MVKTRLLRLLRGVIFGYVLLLLGMITFQRSFLYYPDPQMGPPDQYDLKQAEQIKLKAEDGINLTAWIIPPEEGKPVIVYFHGNGGNLSYRIDKMRAFARGGMGLLALSYRGYGGSEGEPTERGLYQDARAALAYISREMEIPSQRIILYGESLGSGVAVQMAAEMAAAMLVLEAPFTSAEDRAAEIYPWLPVGLFMLDRYESQEKLERITIPALIFHNTGDTVIPVSHGRRLYKALRSPKKAIWFSHQGHVDFDWNRLTQEIEAYYGKHLQAVAKKKPDSGESQSPVPVETKG